MFSADRIPAIRSERQRPSGKLRASATSEPRERREPAKRRASERVGEFEGRSPSIKFRGWDRTDMTAITEYVLVMTTLSTDADSETFARALVDARLAACVNVLPVMESVYRWKGTI